MKTTFIYALCEPGTRTVRYIGKSDNPKKRFLGHLHSTVKEKTPLGEWLRTGIVPSLIILREVPLKDWELAEERYIRLARGCKMNLLNVCDGGEGVTLTPEIRQKMSAAQKGKKKAPFTKAHRAAMSAAHLGDKHGMFGNNHTYEARESISTAQRGKKRLGAASYFIGVCWDSTRRKWSAGISDGGRHYKLGRFEDEIDAAFAHDSAAIKLFGAKAKLNFPATCRELKQQNKHC